MTRDVLYATAIAMGFAAVLPAAASTTQDALKICTERYNMEKSGGTIPVGMSKSKYMNQCTGSIRRAAKLEQDLAEQDQAGGSNDVTATTSASKTTTSKPSGVKTTTSVSLTETPHN